MLEEEIATEDKGELISEEEQLDRWARGESVHRRFERVIVDEHDREIERRPGGACTPDFSCCKPELLADEEVRRAFVAASEHDRLGFLGTFFGAAMELAAKERGSEPPKVHIAGRGPRD